MLAERKPARIRSPRTPNHLRRCDATDSARRSKGAERAHGDGGAVARTNFRAATRTPTAALTTCDDPAGMKPTFSADTRFGRDVLLLAAFVAGYLLLDRVSFIYSLQQLNITPWNPQPALAIALLMRRGQRWLPAVLLTIFAAEFAVRGAPHPLPTALLSSTVLALGYAAIAQALVGPFAVRPAIEDRGDLLRLVGVVIAGALVAAALDVAALVVTGVLPAREYFAGAVKFWIGDSVGVLVTLPLLLMLIDPGRRTELRALLVRREALLQGVTLLAMLFVVFNAAPLQPSKYFYLLFLPIAWVAARSGLAGAAAALALTQLGVIIAVQVGGQATLTVFELQALLAALAITALFVGVTVDERQRANDEMRRTARLASAGRTAAALAHELNQPLTALTGYAKSSRLLAAQPVLDRVRLDATLAKMEAETLRASAAVHRVRELFGSAKPHRQPTDLAALVAQTAAELQSKAAVAGARILIDADPAMPPLPVDPVQIELVLRNLLANAIEAIPPGSAAGRVHVRVAATPGAARIEVEDSGPGVPPDRRAQLFEPFVTTKADGMGMGLAISRAIVEAHGGKLDAVPASRGLFVMTLPSAPIDAADA